MSDYSRLLKDEQSVSGSLLMLAGLRFFRYRASKSQLKEGRSRPEIKTGIECEVAKKALKYLKKKGKEPTSA
jgi:hypothetical protein